MVKIVLHFCRSNPCDAGLFRRRTAFGRGDRLTRCAMASGTLRAGQRRWRMKNQAGPSGVGSEGVPGEVPPGLSCGGDVWRPQYRDQGPALAGAHISTRCLPVLDPVSGQKWWYGLSSSRAQRSGRMAGAAFIRRRTERERAASAAPRPSWLKAPRHAGQSNRSHRAVCAARSARLRAP